MRAKACLLLIVALLFPGTGFSREASPVSREESGKILTRSLLFPGWGQLLQKRYLPAAAFAVSTASLLGFALYQNVKGNSYYRSYRQAPDSESAGYFRELTLRCDRERNIALIAAAAVWALNLLDAWLGEKRRIRLSSEIKDEKITLGIAVAF